MTPAQWQDRYEITSIRGRIWTRSMLRRAVLAYGRALTLRVEARELDEVLDDVPWMSRRRGEIPARVIEAVHTETRWRMHVRANGGMVHCS